MANCVYALTLGLPVPVSSILATDFGSVVKKDRTSNFDMSR